LIIEPLNNIHHRPGFTYGIESLDNYLRKQAKQDVKRRISRAFIATTSDSPSAIIGFYTLSTLSIELQQLPKDLTHKLPRHPVPAALIGRLAVSKQAQGNGIEKMLLMDAIKRTLGVSNEIAIYAIVVDAIDEQAKHFYQQYGFSPLSSESSRLYLPLKSF
jgi:ribosomal protein S18 acetylase RimI-like enzyme